MRYELQLDEQRFLVGVAEGQLEISRGHAERAEVVIETNPATLADVLWNGRSLGGAIRSGSLSLEGSRTAAARFLALFPAA